MRTSSLTSMPPVSKAAFQLRCHSLRLILPLMVSPALVLPTGKNYMTPAGYQAMRAELMALMDDERPKIVELVGEYLRELKRRGIAVLLVEQKLTIALEVADRCLVMGHGQIVFEGTPAELRANAYIRKEWLEV